MLNFLIPVSKDDRHEYSEYAKFSLQRLWLGLNETGEPLSYVLSVAEITAFNERPPIVADIYLADESPLLRAFPILPDFNVSYVVRHCGLAIGLDKVEVGDFGIYVVDSHSEAEMTPGATTPIVPYLLV